MLDWINMMIGLHMPSLWHHQHRRRRPSQIERSAVLSASNCFQKGITELGPSDLRIFLSVQAMLGFSSLLFSSVAKNKPLHAGAALLCFDTVSGSTISLPPFSHCHLVLSLCFEYLVCFVYLHIQTVRTDTFFLLFYVTHIISIQPTLLYSTQRY
ncbi:hypothetical protein P691DRAFT_16622 [Macrolepiota fuliginosa MF-IS2]|uniref:Uncharacterized protein n=1 Tax=Macrolepiota fuliginosa MF-IS2 TaxID=1400762 RepID=A0A9P6C7G4_9AGAR|nr:hypothetical protein P691DRAFT_16622 [Macrolepiota fuliginosa MF-IS2]